MGKKGVLLDNGKVAQSSMALYWKAGQKKSIPRQIQKPHEQKQQDMQSRAGSAMQKWKLHKEKMITKLYTKQQKKDVKLDQKILQQKMKKQQQEMQRQLLQKQLNKNKPISIPGFKCTDQINKKRQFQQVKFGIQENNKLILPPGLDNLSQDDIIQILRQKKAKKQLERSAKQKAQKSIIQTDFLLNNREKTKKEDQKIQQNPIEKIQETPEQKTFFKSQILQKIQKGESILKRQQIKQEIALPQKEKLQLNPQFIPRSLWRK